MAWGVSSPEQRAEDSDSQLKKVEELAARTGDTSANRSTAEVTSSAVCFCHGVLPCPRPKNSMSNDHGQVGTSEIVSYSVKVYCICFPKTHSLLLLPLVPPNPQR